VASQSPERFEDEHSELEAAFRETNPRGYKSKSAPLLSPLDASRGFMFPSCGMPRSTPTLPHQEVRMIPTPPPSGVPRRGIRHETPRSIQRREEYEGEKERDNPAQEGGT
jgi:hypothetical protein